MKHLLPAVQRTALRIPWAAVGGCAAALLLTAAAPGGQYAPWALAAVAAAGVGWPGLLAVVCAGLGALLFMDFQPGLRHTAAALLIWRALLFSTETGYGAESEYPEGLYAHGEYPFVLYKYRDAWRKPFGTGLIYDYYDTQTAIDRYAKYIDDNARESSIQRHFIRRGSGTPTTWPICARRSSSGRATTSAR